MKNNRLTVLLTIFSVIASASWIPAEAQSTGLERRAEIEARYGVKNAETIYDTKSELLKQPNRMGAEYLIYQFDNPKMTPAPSGYKPFYASVTCRHGTRYALSDNIYEKFRSLLTTAHKEGTLTEKGEELRSRYERFYPHVAFRGGDLTAKGQEQTREIAHILYNNFHQLFKGHTVGVAKSTTIPRVIMTMSSFIDELRSLDRDFTYSMDAGRALLPVLEPNGSKNPYREKVDMTPEAQASLKNFCSRFESAEDFCNEFFNDKSFVAENYGAEAFRTDLRNIVVDVQCLDGDAAAEKFEGVFTDEELFGIWEARNYFSYLTYGPSPLADPRLLKNNAAILKDIIDNAERNIASGNVQIDLRFTHDTAVLPLVSFMQIDNFGAIVERPEDVKNFWRSDFIPMSSNLQLIFFRNKAKKDILVKVLYNGHEASLPLHEVAPSFYSWNEFKEFYRKLLEY